MHQAVLFFLRRRRLGAMFSASAAGYWALWFSKQRCRLWAFSVSSSGASCMWDVDLLPDCVGWQYSLWRGSVGRSVSSIYSSFSVSPIVWVWISLLSCSHDMCAFLSLSKMTSDWAFTFFNLGSNILQKVCEWCVWPVMMQGFDLGPNFPSHWTSGLNLLAYMGIGVGYWEKLATTSCCKWHRALVLQFNVASHMVSRMVVDSHRNNSFSGLHSVNSDGDRLWH